MTYFDRESDDFEDWQQAEEEWLHDYRDDEGDFDTSDILDAFEYDHWNYLYSLVISNSYRLDDTPIYNRLTVEHKVWYLQPCCLHGMTPELCEGPMHYPEDNYYDEPPF